MKSNFFTGCALSVLVGMVLPTAAHAADAVQPTAATSTEPAPPAPADAASQSGIVDIVVTAQKRAERLQNVPISVTALSGDQLAKKGLTSLRDLVFQAPALTTSQFSGFSQTFLRGVGTDIIVADAEAGVANYQDGIYQPLVLAPLGALMATQRVEVLYGPQGTLYGRNAVGGAINVITMNPTQEIQADAKATLGNYNRHDFSGYLSGGITSNLAIGVYGAITARDTYLNFVGAHPGTPDHETGQGLRARAVWTPGDDWKFTGTFEYGHTNGVESAYDRELQPNGIGYFFGATTPQQPYAYGGNAPTHFEASLYRYSLEIDKDFHWSNLVSITSYQKAKVADLNDADGTELPLLASGNQDTDLHNFAQELRLQSEAGSQITWIAGLYYFHSVGGFLPQHITVEPGLTGAPGVYERITNNAAQITNSYAVFGQVTVPIIDKLKLTVGGRFSADHKKFYDAYVDTLLTTNAADALGVGYTTGVGAISDSRTNYADQSATWKDFTPKATLDYKLGNALLYATFSQGFKAGTFLYASPSSPGPVRPEKLTDFEGGIKADFDDHRIRVNGSVFHYSYKDLQVTLVQEENGVPTQSIENAAAAKIYGGDVTLTLQPVRELTISGTAAYTHARYTSFPAAVYSIPNPNAVPVCTGQAPFGTCQTGGNAAGNPVQRVPTWSTNVSVNYEKTYADDSSPFANILWSYNSGFSWDPSNIYRQAAYSVVNATIGYTLPGGRFTVSAWATNLFNKAYIMNRLPDAYGDLGSDAPPRMFGGTLEYKFH